jgi:hypothetical protein
MQELLRTIGAGILIAVLGVLIRYRNATSLIAGFDAEKVEDEDGLSNFIGLNAIYVALITTAVGVIEYLSLIENRIYWAVYAAVVVAIAGRMIIGSRSFMKN